MSFNDIKKDNEYKCLIDGEWVFSKTKKTININSPTDNSLIGKIQALDKSEIDNIFEIAKKSQISWYETPVKKRSEILNKVADLILENKELISNLLVKEVTKNKSLAINEIERTVYLIKATAKEGLNLKEEKIKADKFYKSKKKAFIKRIPHGVVLGISPFNYPINLIWSKIAPALISGNSIVIKPSTQGTISVIYTLELFLQAGIPKGVINLITCNTKEIGDYLIKNKNIDMIAFTGSTSIGKRISNLVMKPLLMELGGKDSAIILEDTDLDLAVRECVNGCFSYSGQRCTAIKRIILINSIGYEFMQKFTSEVNKLTFGNPEENNFITPLINQEAVKNIELLVNNAIKNQATKLTNGSKINNLMTPIILDHVNKKCRIYYEEQFGPVAVIIRANNEQEAIDIVNDSDYGLEACIFTKNKKRAFEIAKKLNVGTVQINGKSERSPDNFPFTCLKDSGLGTQGIKYSIEAMTRIKSNVLNQ